MTLTEGEVELIRRQAEAEYPHECCGVILSAPGKGRMLLPCRNIQNELHAQDPVAHPRDARTAYMISPQDLLKFARMESDGYEIQVIYHSHIEAGAYFSETDKRNALIDGEPTYPAATYVVCSVRDGKTHEMNAFRWDLAVHDFLAVPLEIS